MLRSMYTAGTAMLTYSRQMDVVTNNLSNVETSGYKADTLVTRSFRDMLISRLNDPSVYRYDPVGPHNTGIHVDQVFTSWTQGALESTDVLTDLAIAGEGFFCVDYTSEDDEEPVEYYTRHGAFNVDADGMLVTGEGRWVLGEMGEIFVGSTDFTVGPDGTVYDSAGDEIDRLRIVRFEDNSTLRKVGHNMFSNYDPDGENFPEEIEAEVRQGYLETSNVDTARETVMMMQVFRAYEINQRVLRMIDDSLGRAVNDIARI